MPIANDESDKTVTADFFLRNGLKSDDIEACLAVVRDRYTTDCTITPVKGQGGCSYTVVVLRGGSGDVVVQFRKREHAIPIWIALDVRRIFGALVPEPIWFGEVGVAGGRVLQVCAMTRVGGVRFGDVQPCAGRLCRGDEVKLEGLVVDLAGFFARSWKSSRGSGEMNGKVGSTIRQRLVKLENGLPSSWLRSRAGTARRAFDSGILSRPPIVLSHGDLLPSNVLVDQHSWRLTGLIDWAEAEYLPFGITLYGVEHLLGFMGDQQGFKYYDKANELRNVFCQSLQSKVPDLANRDVWEAVMLSREIGILLWHGIAWDDGKLDRVVDRENDGEEVEYLERFLEGSSHVSRGSKL